MAGNPEGIQEAYANWKREMDKGERCWGCGHKVPGHHSTCSYVTLARVERYENALRQIEREYWDTGAGMIASAALDKK